MSRKPETTLAVSTIVSNLMLGIMFYFSLNLYSVIKNRRGNTKYECSIWELYVRAQEDFG
ncbi:Uncharacterised protein [Segatella copri]|nr:Uncharacterised protein [Segatella copri]